jgi:GT2 family glycosyltransferase
VAFNDVDFCLRARAAGYQVVYTPFARLVHHESASRGREERIVGEEYMYRRWRRELALDPFYNPNLTTRSDNFDIDVDGEPGGA